VLSPKLLLSRSAQIKLTSVPPNGGATKGAKQRLVTGEGCHESLVRVREFQALLLSLFFVFISNLPTYVALSTLKCTFYNLKQPKISRKSNRVNAETLGKNLYKFSETTNCVLKRF